MTEVVQDIISSSLLIPNTTRKSTNINRVNEVMYQIERSMGQADLSRYTSMIYYKLTCNWVPHFTDLKPEYTN